MSKDTLLANTVSAGALATVMANLEVGLTILVLVTALIINLRKLFRKDKNVPTDV
jgi:hypothetical protein